MSNQFDSANLMYVTKEYENNLKETARKIYANDEVKLTIENIDKQLNDILTEMNDKLNFISGKIHDPETGVDAYLEGVHTQIDNIDVNARDMIDDGIEATQSHPSIMSVKSDRNATKFNTFDFINKSIRLDANSPLLRFDSKYELDDDDTVHTFRINHDKKEYIKIIEFSFTYKQYPSVMNKNGDELEEEPTVTVTRVISGRFFIIWGDPFNEPGKFIIKAIVENADNTGNIIDKKIIDVKELSKLKEANYRYWKDSNDTTGNYHCITLANNGRLVAGSNYSSDGSSNGIKYSDDNGKTWNNSNITSGTCNCITVVNNGRLVAGYGSKYSDDNGETWNNSNFSGSHECLILANDGRLVAGGSYGIKYSDDNGITWIDSSITSGWYYCIILSNDGRLVAGGGHNTGIKYSDDNGITWNNSSITNGWYNCIILANNGRLVASSKDYNGYNYGIKYSDDNGKTWNNSNITSGDYYYIILANNGRLVAGSNYGIKYSDDNGKTWNNSDVNGNFKCITLANDGTLVAGGYYIGIKYSDDNGITWKNTNIGGSYECITVANDGILVAGGYYTGSYSNGIIYLDTTKTEIEDLSVILDDGPQFDLYFTTDGNSIDISIGKVVPYRWLMRKNYITLESNKPVDNIGITETLETPDFDQSNVFYSKVINTYFIVDKVNHKISYVIGGNKFSNSIPLSPSTNIPYSGEEITDFRLMDTSTFTFLTLNNETYASLNNFESFVKLDYKFTKVFELSTKEILLLRDNGNIHLFDITTGTVNDIVFISPRSQNADFNADYSISEVDEKYIIIFTTTPNGLSYKIKTIDKSTHTYGANQITSLDTEIDSTVLTSLVDKSFDSSTIKSVSNIYGLFVLVNHINEDQTITNIVYLSDIIESGLSYIYKTTKALKEYDYINQTESDLSLPIKDIKFTSMFMFGIGNNGELFIIDSSYVVRAIKTIQSGDLYSDEKSMLYLEKEEDAEDLFLVENPYCNEVIDVIETPNGVFIIDKHGIYELLDSKELHSLIYTEDEFTSSIPIADINNVYGIFVAKNTNSYKFYKTNYNTKNIPRTHIKYKYIDLFNDLYQKFDENKSIKEYDDELPIVKFNSILYVNLIDHLSSIYNTDKFNSIRYIENKTYGDVKIGPEVQRSFNQITNDGTTVSKTGTFMNKKFVLSTNKYGFKKYKDIIKIEDTVKISDINEIKRYVIRNKKDSGKDISVVSANIIKLLEDEYNFIIGEDKKAEKVEYKPIHKSNISITEEFNQDNFGDRLKYSKRYYTANGIVDNKGYFNKLVETQIGTFIHKEYDDNGTMKGAVYYVSPEILCKFVENSNNIPKYLGDVVDNSITPLTDIVSACGWDATKFTSDKINNEQEINYFDVKFIDNGHDTVIITCKEFTAAYDCLNSETRSWSAPFSDSSKITIINNSYEVGFTNIYVDKNIVYLWNSKTDSDNSSSLYRYNTITKEIDNALVSITESSKILNINKINNTLHIISLDHDDGPGVLTYFTIDLISNIKTIIKRDINLINEYEDDGLKDAYGVNNENQNYVVKTYETDKAYIFFIVLLDNNDNVSEDKSSTATIFKYMKNENNKLYKQVKLYNNVPYTNGLYGFTICKDLKNNYKIVGITNNRFDGIFPIAFVYNEESDIITPLECSNICGYINECGNSLLDQEYNKDSGTIDCISHPGYKSSDKLSGGYSEFDPNQQLTDYTPTITITFNSYCLNSIKIPDMVNSSEMKSTPGKSILFNNHLISFNSENNVLKVNEFIDNKLGELKYNFDISELVSNNDFYKKTTDETPDQNKTYYVLNTTQMHFTPINHTMKNNLIGNEVVFKRVENALNYVLVDTVNKQKYPLKGVQYYKKDLNGNYIEVNVTKFDPTTKYYEKENTFIPVDITTLLNNDNLNIQYYRADKYYFDTVSGSFEANTIYFEKIVDYTLNNTDDYYFEEKNNELYFNCICEFAINDTSDTFKIIANFKLDESFNLSLIDFHYNNSDILINNIIIFDSRTKTRIKINDDEYITCEFDPVTEKYCLVRCNYFGTEWYNEYLNFNYSGNFTIEGIRICISENKHIFITDNINNKTYKLSDDYSNAIIINDSNALDIFDTESGIFGITINTSAVLIYKFNETSGLFDEIIFNKNDGNFIHGDNVCITMDDGFKSIFIFGLLNNRPTCYRIYKGSVSIYTDFDSEIMSLQFNKYIIYNQNNKICFTPIVSDGTYFVVDVNKKTTISKLFNILTFNKIYQFDDEYIYLLLNGSETFIFSSNNELYDIPDERYVRSLSPIDTYNTRLPVIDKNGFLWYKNTVVDIKTGLPDPSKYYIAYEKDKKTIKYDHIVFRDMIATEDGIFGIKDGCIYLNRYFSDSNDFVIVFSNIIENEGTNYNIGFSPENDVLLYSEKFGIFYHAPNGMIFRWNGSEFVSVFGDIINTANNAKRVVGKRFNDQIIYDRVNKESNKVNCLFYVNENVLLILDKNNVLHYFDINSGKFENFDTNTRNEIYDIVETSIGTLLISCKEIEGIKYRNTIELITYSNNSVKISTIRHSGYFLNTTDFDDVVDNYDRYHKIFEDPISKLIIIAEYETSRIYVIDKTNDGYKMFTYIVPYQEYEPDIGSSISALLTNIAYHRTGINRNCKEKILTTLGAFNIKFNNDKSGIIFENIDTFNDINCIFNIDDEIYCISDDHNIRKMSYDKSNKTISFDLYENAYILTYMPLFNCDAINWNGIIFISYNIQSESDPLFKQDYKILASFGKLFERTITENKNNSIGFDLTFTIKNSNVFNNLDEITENSLIDKLVIKTTGIFVKNNIKNLKSYIINNQRYKNIKEIETKYPNVFNLFKNIYKKYNNKNLVSYRFNDILSNSSDSLVLGFIDNIDKSYMNDLILKILNINELNDDYKIEINVYPAAITKFDTVKEVIGFDVDGGADMPKLDRVPYKAFNPFED